MKFRLDPYIRMKSDPYIRKEFVSSPRVSSPRAFPSPHLDQRGVALFLTILVMGATAVAVLLGLTQQSLSAIVQSNKQAEALVARSAVFGCLDEVLIQLAGDSAWSEASVTTPDAVCNVTLVPSGQTADVLVTAPSGSVTRGVAANITLDPLIVNDVAEALSL